MLSNLLIAFSNNSLPFDLKLGVLIDNPQPESISVPITTKTINQQIVWNSSLMTVSIQNYVSLEAIRYAFLVKTLDFLYDIFSF